MTEESITARALLRFSDEVKSHFSFLKSLGFRCTRSAPTFVRYETAQIGINIYHGRHSFEIGLEIESKSPPTKTYPLPVILRLVDVKLSDNYKYYATHTVQGVAEGVAKLVELFQHCVAIGILNDERLFARLEIQSQKLISDFALKVELLQARRAAETAWHKKDYAGVVKAFKPLRAALTATEIGKLEYSEKKCGQC